MRYLSLQFPGGQTINNPDNFRSNNFSDIGSAVSSFLNLGMIIAGVLLVSWFAWGAFQYTFAGGDKTKLANARKRIIYALIGFMLVALAFIIKDFILQIFPNQVTNIQTITP